MKQTDNADSMIASYTDWRGDLLAKLRKLVNEASPDLKEGWKWSVPVWESNGLVCAISAFKDHVKINFFHGVSLPDPKHLFNSGLDSTDHRSINFSENENVDEVALRQLIKEAVAYNNK